MVRLVQFAALYAVGAVECRASTSVGAHGMSVAHAGLMSRQVKGALLGVVFLAAFIISVALHSVIASAIVLFTALSVTFIVGISWMRTTPNRVRGKESSPH